MAIDLSEQKELDADPKAIQQIKFVGKLKKLDDDDDDDDDDYDDGDDDDDEAEIYVYFNDFRKNQRNEVRFFSRKCDSIIKHGKLSRSES